MPRMVSDFRSDTLTVPTAAMREAMARAEVGDDVFGEDPTVRALEGTGAQFLGMDAALFVPSGTMANQLAVHVHCRPGDELLCEERSHLYVYECASVARLSGTQVRPLRSVRGFPAPAQLAPAIRPPEDVHSPRSRLLSLENTHNMAGGTVLPPDGMAALVAEARRLGLLVHLDGARLVNAAVSAGCSVPDLTRGLDSVSMCLSKGLGAPVGSLLAGSAEFVARARLARKAFGGGMRQAGVLAAPALIALEEGSRTVAEDHRRARTLADGLQQLNGLRVIPPESNIVMVELEAEDSGAFVDALDGRGVRALRIDDRRVRFTTHRDLGDEDVAECVDAVRRRASEWNNRGRNPAELRDP